MGPSKAKEQTMRHPTTQLSALIGALMLAGATCAQTTVIDEGSSTSTGVTTPTTAPGQSRVATRVAGPFATLAGSRENAVALATALRNGTPVTLTYASTIEGGEATATTTTITPRTKPMGWGNVSHALALARFSLAQAGVTNPTGSELNAALVGGTITGADGSSVPLSGVLQQRASGMGWGTIAHSYGTTMGAVNRSIKTQAIVASATPATPKTGSSPKTGGVEPKPGTATDTLTTARGNTSGSASAKGITNASGTSGTSGHASKRLATAGGTPAATGHGSKGLTTASGAGASSGSSGVVTAEGRGHGQAHGYGRGIVTASGGNPGATSASTARGGPSAGTVTASGATASGVVSAQPGHAAGNGNGNGHGRGKGGG
jgi:hypothetical protein